MGFSQHMQNTFYQSIMNLEPWNTHKYMSLFKKLFIKAVWAFPQMHLSTQFFGKLIKH